MILEEEYKEASGMQITWGCVLGGSTGVTMSLLDAGLKSGQVSVYIGVSSLLALVSVVGLFRCRRTIKAWRDQKRLELAQRGVEKMGAAK